MNKNDMNVSVRRISSEVYEYAEDKNKRLVPTLYKILFKKMALKLGFTNEDLERFDSELFIENRQKILETKRSKDLSKVHGSISNKVKKLLLATVLYSSRIKNSKDLKDLSKDTLGYLSKLNKTKKGLEADENILSNIADMIFKDPLTGLLNRRFMNMILKREFYRLKRYGTELSIIIADIDKFKDVNDTYGHMVGDRVLSSVAELLINSSRTSDTIVRYGGEEMVIICPSTKIECAVLLAEKLRYLLSKLKFKVKSKLFSVSLSFGVAECRADDGEDELPIKALKRMDDALYQSKRSGRNKVSAL